MAQRVREGSLDVASYIEHEVDRAMAPLKGLTSSELESIRSALREQMATDPGLVDLVRAATGKVPSLPDEG